MLELGVVEISKKKLRPSAVTGSRDPQQPVVVKHEAGSQARVAVEEECLPRGDGGSSTETGCGGLLPAKPGSATIQVLGNSRRTKGNPITSHRAVS